MSLNEANILEDLQDILNEEQITAIQDTQANNGGDLLRTIEFLFPDEILMLWQTFANMTGRRLYTTTRDLETLEEPVLIGQQWEPMLSRTTALQHQALAQRTEGQILCLLSVDPWFDLDAPALWKRAHQVSLTGQGQLKVSIVPPALYRQCLGLAYPDGLYGPLRLIERLSITGLVRLGDLDPFTGHEHQSVEAGLITEHDYASCLAQDLNLPLYDFRKPVVDWNILPAQLITQLGIIPLRDHQSHIDVLTAAAPVKSITEQLQRQSGRHVQYEITTPSVIRALLAQRTSHA